MTPAWEAANDRTPSRRGSSVQGRPDPFQEVGGRHGQRPIDWASHGGIEIHGSQAGEFSEKPAKVLCLAGGVVETRTDEHLELEKAGELGPESFQPL